MTRNAKTPPSLTLAISNDEPRSAAVLEQLTAGLVLLDEAITELADADAVRGIAKLLAQRVELKPDTVIRALDALSEEPVTVLCRAAGLNINGFSAVLRMRRRRHASDSSPSVALAAFHELSSESAQRVVALLRVREVG